MIQKLKERWFAEETAVGKFIKNWIGVFLGACAAVGASLEYIANIPIDFIPEWMKNAIAILAFIGFVAGKMTKKTKVLILLLLPALCFSQVKVARTIASGYGYIEYQSRTNKNAPLLLVLHGNGEIGNGIEDLYKLERTGIPMLLKNKPARLDSFLIICPQSKTTSIPAKNLNKFINYLISVYDFDTTRIYLTGLSGGAINGMGYVKTYNRIAAAVFVAGTTSTKELGLSLNTPMWLFHGDADKQVPVTGSTNFYKALSPIYKEIKITVYPGVGHNSWDRTYNLSGMNTGKLEHNFGTSYKPYWMFCDQYKVDVYSWLLKHKK